MAAYLERFDPLTLMESDDGLTVHLDVADLDALGSYDNPLAAPGVDGGKLADVVRCGMIERADGLNLVLDGRQRTMLAEWLREFDPESAAEIDGARDGSGPALREASATAPSSWAVYFFNDDPTVFEGEEDDGDAEQAAADAFADWLRGTDGHIVSAEDAGFLEHPDSRTAGFWPYAADCRTYVALIGARERGE